jgi:hypothetical protein
MAPDHPDEELVRRCREELPYVTRAFEALVRRYEPLVFRTEIACGDDRGYREAELKSIRTDILGTARSERDAAILERAEERAAITLGRADDLLEQAEQVLQGDRYQRAEARKLAEQATEEYRHAVLIARRSLAIDKDRKRAPEKLILDYESEAARIAETLRFEPAFSEGMQTVADQMIAAVNSILEDRANMQQQLSSERAQVDSLKTRLASLSKRDAELSLREKRERRLRRCREHSAARRRKFC